MGDIPIKRSPLKVLILEDTKSDAELVKMHLEDIEYECVFRLTDRRVTYIRLLEEFQPDIVISDFNLPSFDGMQALKILRELDDLTPLIFLTGTLGEENAVEAIRSGATDFIVKNRVAHLPAAVMRALREKVEKQAKKDFAKQLEINALFVSSLLKYDEWEKALGESFPLIGEAASVDKVYYFQNCFDERTGKKTASQRISWSRGDTEIQIKNPKLQNLPFCVFKDFIDPLSNRCHFKALVSELTPGTFKESLIEQGTLSLLVLPVFIRESFYGFIGFDDCKNERIWSLDDISFLETLSFNLAIAIEKKGAALAVKESEQRFKTVISNIPGITYQCIADKHWTMLFISDEVERMTGFPPSDFILNEKRSYSSIIHPDDLEQIYLILDQLRSREAFNMEYRIVCADGTYRWVEEKGVAIYKDDLLCIDGVIMDVTEKKKATEKIEAIFAQTSDAILLADDSGNYIDVNEAAKSMFGYSEKEFRKMNIRQLMSVQTETEFSELWTRFLNSGEQTGRIELLGKDGSEIMVSYKAKANILPGVHLSIITDIAEMVKQEAQLIASERKFKALVQSASDVVAILDLKGNYLFVSDNVAAVFNTPPQQFIGKNVFDVVHDVDREDFFKQYTSLSEKKQIHMRPFRFINSKNELKVIDAIATNLTDDPAVGGIVINARDVTESMLQKEELKVSNERFEIAMKATNEMIWDWDVVTGYVTRSQGFESIFGFQELESTHFQQFWFENIHDEDVDITMQTIRTALEDKNQEKWDIEYRLCKANGEIAFISDQGYIIRDQAGKAIRVVGSVSDVSESRKMIHEISQQNKALREIAWTQSHIVRAPLARLRGLVDILDMEEFDMDTQAEILRNIRASALELDGIIKNIVSKTDQLKSENP